MLKLILITNTAFWRDLQLLYYYRPRSSKKVLTSWQILEFCSCTCMMLHVFETSKIQNLSFAILQRLSV
jgi:hypothetical protein